MKITFKTGLVVALVALALSGGSVFAQTRSAELKKRTEMPRQAGPLPDPDYSITLPLTTQENWWIVPEFPYKGQTKITATTPEDGKLQEWTGTKGQEADAWVLSGYNAVNIHIERFVRNKWISCPLTIKIRPMPSPDRTRRISGNCGVGENGRTEVSVIPVPR